jgi:hypothetical protein
VADRAERRSAPARTQRLASRVVAAREPKLLRAATRLAAARTRMSWAAASWEVTRNYSELPPEGQTTGPARPAPAMQRAVAPRVASAALGAPASSALQRAPAPATRRVVARAPAPPRDAAGTAGTAGGSALPASAPALTPESLPALTPESLGLGPASFEWLFGDPDKALSHPDVTSGPLVSLPSMSSQQRTARRVARLTARGGSPYGRGAEIREGAAKPPDPPAPVERAGEPPAGGPPPATASPLTTTPPPLATPPSPAAPRSPEPAPSPAAPASPEPAPTVEAVQRQLQRMRRDPAPASPPAAPRRPERRRLVTGRRPAAIARREVARAVADPVPAIPSEPATPAAPEPAPATGPEPAPAPAPHPATAAALSATLRAAPVRPELARQSLPARTRPALQRAPRPAIEPIPSPAPPRADVTAPPAPRKPSLLRRALAALKPPAPSATVAPPRSEPAARADFGVPANTYVAAAPKSGVAVPRPTLNARPPATPRPLSRAPITAPATAAAPQTPVFTPPPPPLWAPAEHSSTKPLARAPADPPAYAHPATPHPATPHPATPGENPSPTHNPAAAQPAQTTPPADADAAYRDVLLRAREEREQLGRLISHPF